MLAKLASTNSLFKRRSLPVNISTIRSKWPVQLRFFKMNLDKNPEVR